MKKSKTTTQFHFPLEITHYPKRSLQLNNQKFTCQPQNYRLISLAIIRAHDNTIVFIRIWIENDL